MKKKNKTRGNGDYRREHGLPDMHDVFPVHTESRNENMTHSAPCDRDSRDSWWRAGEGGREHVRGDRGGVEEMWARGAMVVVCVTSSYSPILLLRDRGVYTRRENEIVRLVVDGCDTGRTDSRVYRSSGRTATRLRRRRDGRRGFPTRTAVTPVERAAAAATAAATAASAHRDNVIVVGGGGGAVYRDNELSPGQMTPHVPPTREHIDASVQYPLPHPPKCPLTTPPPRHCCYAAARHSFNS